MKFGKSLLRVVELSDPEWGPYWINYKGLKKKINDIVVSQGGAKISVHLSCDKKSLSQNACEVEFFRLLRNELKKACDFYASSEQLYKIRQVRVWEGYNMLLVGGVKYDKDTWTRLLQACVKFYKDVLLLENYAIMNYCGVSKILKKHDKLTGYVTRDAFMRNVMPQQNLTNYSYVMDLLRQAEKLFSDIQSMQNVMPLSDQERLFIDAIRDLNYQASRMQAEEKQAFQGDPNSTTQLSAEEDERIMKGFNDAADAVVQAAANLNKKSGPSPNIQWAISWMESVSGDIRNEIKRGGEDLISSSTDDECKSDNNINSNSINKKNDKKRKREKGEQQH